MAQFFAARFVDASKSPRPTKDIKDAKTRGEIIFVTKPTIPVTPSII